MFVAALCLVDRGASSASALTAFTAPTGISFPTVQTTRVGGSIGVGGLPSLALSGRGDACAHGSADTDWWWFGAPLPWVHVDPARRSPGAPRAAAEKSAPWLFGLVRRIR